MRWLPRWAGASDQTLGFARPEVMASRALQRATRVFVRRQRLPCTVGTLRGPLPPEGPRKPVLCYDPAATHGPVVAAILAARTGGVDYPPVEPGHVLSRKYRLDRRLAEGGMGEVWSARHERTQRDCAIKVLLPSLARNGEALHRFVKEARAAGRLTHPGIVEVFDAGKTGDGRPYLVMELLRGESLSDRLLHDGSMNQAETCVILAQVARAVQYGHEHGVVHRDLSASNVFLVRQSEGEVPRTKILDFGVSKVLDDPAVAGFTLDGALLGSPAYMSPEQAMGADGVDHRTDVWSLGVLIYQCLAGALPFQGRNHNTTMLAVLSRPHTPLSTVAPDIDAELADFVEACLIKDRQHRVQTAKEVAETLERVARRLAREPGILSPRRRLTDRLPEHRGDRRARTTRRTPAFWIAMGGAAVGIALGVWLGAALVQGADPTPIAKPRTTATPTPTPAAEATCAVPTATQPTAQPTTAPASPPAESSLAQAVAAGLGVE